MHILRGAGHMVGMLHVLHDLSVPEWRNTDQKGLICTAEAQKAVGLAYIFYI